MNGRLILSIQEQRAICLKAVSQMVGRDKEQKLEVEVDILIAEMQNQNTDHDMFMRFV